MSNLEEAHIFPSSTFWVFRGDSLSRNYILSSPYVVSPGPTSRKSIHSFISSVSNFLGFKMVKALVSGSVSGIPLIQWHDLHFLWWDLYSMVGSIYFMEWPVINGMTCIQWYDLYILWFDLYSVVWPVYSMVWPVFNGMTCIFYGITCIKWHDLHILWWPVFNGMICIFYGGTCIQW